jgi:hypothetical protein
MSLISTGISNLVGGVSQQPPSLRLPNQCERQENALASAFEGLIKRPPAEHVAVLKNAGVDLSYDSASIHVIDRSETERYVVVFGRNNTGNSSYIKVYDINGVEKTVHIPDGVDYINEANIDTKLRCVTVADVTFVVNRNKTVLASTTKSPWSRNTATNISEAMIWVRQTNYKRHFEVNITKGGTTKQLLYQTGSGAGDDIGTEEVASQLAADYTASPHTGLSMVRVGNVLWFYGSTSSDTFDVTLADDFGGEAMSLTTRTVNSFDDLPDVAPHGYLVKVLGSENNAKDDYWVRFVQSASTPSTTTLSAGYWREDMGPNLTYDFNLSTMPHILVREANGDFRFKQANGTTYADFDWVPRTVGDDDSSPMPQFVDNKIRDINFFRDRLVVLSGEYITMSEIGDPFNFFPTTVQDLVDTDPIEVGSTQPEVMDFKSSVVFSDRLVAFTPQAQLTLRGDGFLSSKTVSLTQSASFENIDVRPISSGTSIFFAFNRGSYSGVREMVVSNSLDLQFDAIDVTIQVPQYLAGSVVKMAASTHENYVIALCKDELSSLFVYKYFNQGDQRVQSAWSKFTFRDATILDIQFLDTTLYVVLKRGTSTVLEKIRMESGRKDSGSLYVTALDRRLTPSQCVSISYNATTNRTTYTLPYVITSNAQMEVVTTGGLRLATTRDSSTTLSVQGNYQTNFWIGDKYTMLYEFSEQLIKTANQAGGITAVLGGRYQIRYGTLAYGNSAYFKVKVQIDAGSTYEYPFTGRNMGAINNLVGSISIDSGNFRFPVYSRNSQVKILVENDSPLPSNLLSAEYEALFSDRSLRR